MIESILKGFEVWTEAQGVKSKGRIKSIDNISLEGIIAIRQLIIELAVRGKLVGQNSDDAPATDLLKETIKNKENLILEGKVRKERNTNDDSVADTPFDTPRGWVWVALQTISTINGGYAFKSGRYSDEGHRVIRISDFDEKGFKDTNVVRHEYTEELEPFLLFEKNILLAMTGGTVGKSYLVKELNEPMLVNQRVASINLIKPIHEEFIHYVIQSKHVKDVIDEAKNSTNDNISMSDIKGFKIPLPPLAEQIRITEKINELFSWCDQLEKQQKTNLTTHHYLVKTLLETLINASDSEELQTAWERISQQFDPLFYTEDSIDQLKQAILQLAIMGKLVKQDSNDGSARELLNTVKKAKEKLIATGEVTKEKNLPEIDDSEKPFKLPDGWSWCRLSDICRIITKGSSPKWQGISYTENPNDILFITSENVGSYKLLIDSNKKYVERKFNEIEPRSVLKSGDFLMNIVGGSIGRTAMFNIDEIANINQAVCMIRLIEGFFNSSFMLHFFNSSICISYMFDKQVDNARANLSMGNISKFVIPVPPTNEQDRIVSRINELFLLCDSLSSRIIKRNEIQKELSHAIIRGVI